MKKIAQLYSGKAKTLYSTEDPDLLVMDFRDDTSAFDGEKVAKLARKGMVNNYINAFIMGYLEANGIDTHFVKLQSEHESVVKHLNMMPIECVVRNFATGSLCRRLGIQEGIELNPPIFEFFLKNDALHDPMINASHIITFKWATQSEIESMRVLSHRVNGLLKGLFYKIDIHLVDYKLEFGRLDGKIVLGDEFTPDGCRLWDVATKEKLDKDRFRRDLGNVIEAYELVAERLGIKLPEEVSA